MPETEIKKVKIISDSMQEIDSLARSLIKKPEDALLVCAALMAVTRQHYIDTLGPDQTSFVFQSVVESLDYMAELESQVANVTIH